MRSFRQTVVIALILIVTLLYVMDLVAFSGVREAQVRELPPTEIREYEGEDLSSITAFRENSIRGPQYIATGSYTLSVSGLVNESSEYNYTTILGTFPHYSKVVTLYCVEGWDVTILWEGVLVRDLLDASGISPVARTVIFTAYDGYTTSFPADYFYENDIIMAYSINGVTLPPERGYPFQLVAEDKWGYKWIKWITAIELSDDVTYRGYWERRGFSDSGDLDRSFFD